MRPERTDHQRAVERGRADHLVERRLARQRRRRVPWGPSATAVFNGLMARCPMNTARSPSESTSISAWPGEWPPLVRIDTSSVNR